MAPVPPGWPKDVQYLTRCQPSPKLNARQRQALCDWQNDALIQTSRRMTMIQAIEDRSHPACGQSGLFAKTSIPPRTTVVQYLGLVHTEEESELTSDYDLRVSGPSSAVAGAPNDPDVELLGIDATYCGNEARFVNDYRGVPGAVRPNVFFEEVDDDQGEYSNAHSRRCGLVLRTGAHPVQQGQELLVSYGKGFWAARKPSEGDTAEVNASSPSKDSTPQASAKQPSYVETMLAQRRAKLQQMKSGR